MSSTLLPHVAKNKLNQRAGRNGGGLGPQDARTQAGRHKALLLGGLNLCRVKAAFRPQ